MTIEESQGVAPADSDNPMTRLRSRVLDQCEVELPPSISAHLGVRAYSKGVRIDYLAYAGSRPIALITNYMRMPEAAQLTRARFVADYYRFLIEAGLETTETTYLIEATVADSSDAELLQVEVGAAIMVAEQALLNTGGEAFNYAFVRGRGDSVALLSQVGRGADAPGRVGESSAEPL
jgi:GntR family transcriptional regulator